MPTIYLQKYLCMKVLQRRNTPEKFAVKHKNG